MTSVIKEIANKVAATMRKDEVGFPIAFRTVMVNYPNLNWDEVKSSVGSDLGKRKRRPRRKKVPTQQLEMFLEVSHDEHIKCATEHEASLTAGIPDDDR